MDFSFPGVASGTYTVTAQATDGANVLFEQSSSVVVGGTDTAITLNLVPVDASSLASLPQGESLELGEASSVSYRVHASEMSSGAFWLDLAGTDSAIECFVQDQAGASLAAKTGSAVFGVQGAGDSAIVTFYNPDSSTRAYESLIHAPNSLVVAPASTVYDGTPAAFTATYFGDSVSAISWTLDGAALASDLAVSASASGSTTVSGLTALIPSGTHTLTAAAVDASSGTTYTASASVTPAANAAAATGLVGEWLLQTDYADSSGSGGGIGVGSGTITQTTGYKTGDYCYQLAMGDTITASAPALLFSYAGAFSYSLWFKYDSASLTQGYGAFAMSVGASSGNFYYGLDAYHNYINGILGKSGQTRPFQTSGDTNWHHAVLTCNAGSGILYLDGVQKVTGTYTVTFSAGAETASGSLVFGGAYFAGCVERCRFYNRVLSAAEAKALYNE